MAGPNKGKSSGHSDTSEAYAPKTLEAPRLSDEVPKSTNEQHPEEDSEEEELARAIALSMGFASEISELDDSGLRCVSTSGAEDSPATATPATVIDSTEDDTVAALLQMEDHERNSWLLRHSPDVTSAIHLHEQIVKRITPLVTLGDFLQGLATFSCSEFDKERDFHALENALNFIARAFEDLNCDFENIARIYETIGSSFSGLLYSGSLKDIDNYVHCCQRAVDLTPDGHVARPTRLNGLGTALAGRYYRFGGLPNIDAAIKMHQLAIHLTPDGQPDKTEMLNRLGIALGLRYQRVGESHDLDEAVKVQQQAVDLTPDNHTEKSARLGKLGILFNMRFSRFGQPEDCDKAIEIDHQVIGLTPDDHPDKSRRLNDLGVALIARFRHFHDIDALHESISVHQEAVSMSADDYPDKPRQLTNLGFALDQRFERFGQVQDIDNAISIQRRAVDLSPDSDLNKPPRLINLSSSHLKRFERLGNGQDIDTAIDILQHALHLTPNNHPSKSDVLSNFAGALTLRADSRAELEDNNQVVEILQQALDLIPDGHPEKPLSLSNLGDALRRRFDRFGESKDIDSSILLLQNSVDLTPRDHTDKLRRLTSLGNSLDMRFTHFGQLPDIDRAITVHWQAVNLAPDDLPIKHILLSNLGISLAARFTRLRVIKDIDFAVISHRKAIALLPVEDASKPQKLTNLGIALETRFHVRESVKDINEAIAVHQEAVQLTPDGHTLKPSLFLNLAGAFDTRFGHSGELSDIDAAITFHRKSLALIPNDSPTRSSQLSNLGCVLEERYNLLGEPQDIDEAVAAHRSAVALTPDGLPYKAHQLRRLGLSLWSCFNRSGELSFRDEAVVALRAAATSDVSSPFTRFKAAKAWAKICAKIAEVDGHFEALLEAHRVVKSVIPRIVWLGTTVEQRYTDIQEVGTAANEAVSAACWAGDYDLALEWMEQGRSIVWGQILHLRSPMDSLAAVRPELASELNKVATVLEAAGTQNTRTLKPVQDDSPEKQAQEHRRAAEKWEKLLEEVRSIPEFNNFLQPKRASELKHAASRCDGLIVAVNVSKHRSDAIILQPGSDSVGQIPLKGLSLPQLEKAQTAFFKTLLSSGVRERGTAAGGSNIRDAPVRILQMLWNDAVKPILDYLGYRSLPRENLPCITWCLTGPLASLPIHAAGIYDGSDQESKLYNYVVSSYVPSITALLASSGKVSQTSPSLLAITQASTPGLSRLPGTVTEVTEVEKQIRLANRPVTWLDGEKATVSSVLQQMSVHNWIHLACHGKQDAFEPTKSAFHLHGGTLELGEIMKKPLKHADLAYLSACQTASGDAKLPDEAVHLAAGMFVAGYRSVVATLWSIQDTDAPLVANEFYRELLANPASGAARALHHAVGLLRGNNDKDFLSWVPYIHIGH